MAIIDATGFEVNWKLQATWLHFDMELLALLELHFCAQCLRIH